MIFIVLFFDAWQNDINSIHKFKCVAWLGLHWAHANFERAHAHTHGRSYARMFKLKSLVIFFCPFLVNNLKRKRNRIKWMNKKTTTDMYEAVWQNDFTIIHRACFVCVLSMFVHALRAVNAIWIFNAPFERQTPRTIEVFNSF